jgi:hypothetical protein
MGEMSKLGWLKLVIAIKLKAECRFRLAAMFSCLNRCAYLLTILQFRRVVIRSCLFSHLKCEVRRINCKNTLLAFQIRGAFTLQRLVGQ